jgi:fructokinase
MKRKIYTSGETVFDIIFKNSRPQGGNPGGSVLNSAVSLGRLGLAPVFLSDFCNDMIGEVIKNFLKENGVKPKQVIVDSCLQTSVALAFLDADNNAKYEFYKSRPKFSDTQLFTADFHEDDIYLFGSYYGIMPEIRDGICNMISQAKANNAIVVYDPNFRRPHLKDLPHVLPFIIDNFEKADIIKGSHEDFELIFNTDSQEETFYKLMRINPNAHLFYTKGKNGCSYCFKGEIQEFVAPKIVPISTIGAGDNFNAGIVYGVVKHNLTKSALSGKIEKDVIKDIVEVATKFAQFACMSNDNYISQEFANSYKI